MPTSPNISAAAPRAAHPHRTAARCVTALTVLSLVVPAAGALTPLPQDRIRPRFTAPVWATPAPADTFTRNRATLLPDATRFAPAFRAPSATRCARPMRSHEEPGTQAHLAPNALKIGRAHPHAAPAAAHTSPDAAPAPSSGSETAGAASIAAEPAAADAGGTAADARERSGSATQAAKPTPSAPLIARPTPDAAPVTAGMVDDNASFAEYLAFRDRTQVAHRPMDVRERVLLQVRDPRGRAVPDAEVVVRATRGAAMWARTDAAGRAWLSPDTFDGDRGRFYEVTVRQGHARSSAVFQRGQQSAVDVTLDAAAPAQRARLDLVFLVDATGSMGDEIAKLKSTLRTIASEVAALPSRPDTCFGLVAYRDKTDAFVLRSHDFTNDLRAFQTVLDQLQADGGGDEPEAMNEALSEAVHALSWRGTGATRLMVLLADAPPHLDHAGPQYDATVRAALGKGIKVFSVGASGLNKQGETIQRQIAQYTGGRFVFLTYAQAQYPASGPGRETVHDVSNYSVDTLDRLIVRLVTDELAQLPQAKRRR